MYQTASTACIGGVHAVLAALEGSRPVYRVWRAGCLEDRADERLTRALQDRGLAPETVKRATLDGWLPAIAHQGIAAEVAMPVPIGERELAELARGAGENDLVLVLDQVQDPHNLGACLRSAAAAGVSAVVAPKRRAVGLTATAVKVAAGGAEHVPFARVTNLARALGMLQEHGFFAVGLDDGAAVPIDTLDLTGRRIIVAGGEADGLRQRTAACCDEFGSIPLPGPVRSLNVSVAVGVALFEVGRQSRESVQ